MIFAVEPRYNEVSRDWTIYFITGVRYKQNPDITEFNTEKNTKNFVIPGLITSFFHSGNASES